MSPKHWWVFASVKSERPNSITLMLRDLKDAAAARSDIRITVEVSCTRNGSSGEDFPTGQNYPKIIRLASRVLSLTFRIVEDIKESWNIGRLYARATASTDNVNALVVVPPNLSVLFMKFWHFRSNPAENLYCLIREPYPLNVPLYKKWISFGVLPLRLFELPLIITLLVADKVFVESCFDSNLLKSWAKALWLPRKTINLILEKIEVQHNWTLLHHAPLQPSIQVSRLSNGVLYLGNISHLSDSLLVTGLSTLDRLQVPIHFYGSHDEKARDVINGSYFNVRSLPYIDTKSLARVAKKYRFGLIALDRNTPLGNIPGKVMSYLELGLEILCIANPQSEIYKLVMSEKIGYSLHHDDSKIIPVFEAIASRETPARHIQTCYRVLNRRFNPHSFIERLIAQRKSAPQDEAH